VDIFEGNLTLTGAVENQEQKDRGEAIAKSAYGLRKVNNLLSIKKK